MPTATASEAVLAARDAGLRFVRDDAPGLRRVGRGKRLRYVDADAKTIRDAETLARIRSLAIPPAWADVWVCPRENGHLQATGRDAKGRKQYRYHPRWREARDETKYGRVVACGQALPKLRERIDADLALPGLPREKVLATVVRLLETTLIRVGNEEYARDNGSFGLTTLRNRHVAVDGEKVRFAFRGKSGVKHKIDVRDRRLAKVVRRCRDLPGQALVQYVGDDGETRGVDSADVNEYIHAAAGEGFTAKDFRTWAGTLLAARALAEFTAFDSEAQAKRNVLAAIEAVAKRLGNTTSVCRKCYVHPEVVNAYLDGTLKESLRGRVEAELREKLADLDPEEAAVLAFLRRRLG